MDAEHWNHCLIQYPDTHILQSAEWAELKGDFGWEAERIAGEGWAAQVLFKHLPGGFSLGYLPKGPTGKPGRTTIETLVELGKKHHAVFIKIEPDKLDAEGLAPFIPDGKRILPAKPVQPRRTIIIDLSGEDTEILGRMKQKTRYNINLAQKKDVDIVENDDVSSFHRLMVETGTRDQFSIHSEGYYRKAYDLFASSNRCVLLTARYGGTDLASVMVFRQGRRAWYFYGASNDRERNRMPVYLLQWRAIQWAKNMGCLEYDLWGIPDNDEDDLEAG